MGKIAAAVLGGVDDIWIKPGSKVLYIGAAAGTSVSHVSDIVGKTGAVIAVKASCIDSTAAPEAVFRREVSKLQKENFKPLEQLTLEPYERDHAVVIAQYRPSKSKAKE